MLPIHTTGLSALLWGTEVCYLQTVGFSGKRVYSVVSGSCPAQTGSIHVCLFCYCNAKVILKCVDIKTDGFKIIIPGFYFLCWYDFFFKFIPFFYFKTCMWHLVVWRWAPTYTNSTHIDKHLHCHLRSAKGMSAWGRAALPLCYWHVSPSRVHFKEHRLPFTFMSGVKLYLLKCRRTDAHHPRDIKTF